MPVHGDHQCGNLKCENASICEKASKCEKITVIVKILGSLNV